MESWYRVQAALLAAIICLALAVNVLLRARRGHGGRSLSYQRFAWLNIALVGWFVVDALYMGEVLSFQLARGFRGVLGALLCSAQVAFFSAFAGSDDDSSARWATNIARIVAGALVVTSIAVLAGGGLFESSDAQVRTLAVVDLLVSSAFGAATLTSTALLLWRLRAIELPAERARLAALTIASASVFGLALFAYSFDIGVAFLGNILLAVYMFFMFQVLTFRRILDLFEFSGRVVVLAGFAVVLSFIYALLVGWWRHDFGLFIFNTVIATIVILILLDPLRAFVEDKLNELIFREKYEFTKHAEAIRRGLANVIDIGAMAELLLGRLEASKQVTHAGIYLRDEEGLAFSRLAFIGTAPPTTLDAIVARPFLTRLLSHKVLIIEHLEAERAELADRGGVEDHGQLEVLDAILETMRELETALTVAFESDGQLLGFLNVKDERLREAYSTEQIRALVALAAQATITIENSRLFDRIRERDRLAAVGEMAAGLAHEIRNPLGAIKGSAQLLTEVAAEQRATYLAIITDEVDRLDKVVSQFLTYARPLKGKRDAVDVNEILERTMTLVRADEHDSEVELDRAPNLPPIRSDPELLRQVILNLARNGIEAMATEGGGKLRISTALTWQAPRPPARTHGDDESVAFIRIRVEDDGPGMPPEVMERLFIPFYTTKPQGTGLGLAICQRIIKNLGGAIEVSSRVGRGTTFSVLLPVAEAATRTTVTG